MIVGGRITSAEGRKLSEGPIKGLNINMTIDNVTIVGTRIDIAYSYTATYADNIGSMTLKGIITADEDKPLAKEISENWNKHKKLPDDYAEMVLNTINYTGTANGTLLARVLNLSPPLVPPKIQITRGK